VITMANMVVATGNNAARIAMSVEKAAKGLIKGGKVTEGLLNKVEMAFRAYDPCLGCATHSLPGHTALVARIYDSNRQLVQEIISRAPRFGPAHVEIAKQLEKAGQFAQAADEARRALEGEGNDGVTKRSARSVLAKCLFALGQKKEAEEQRQLIEAESKGKPQ